MTDPASRLPTRVQRGYFTEDSMIRTVLREHVVGFSGPRALLMQAAHPVAFAGFFAHTGALDDPYGRLRRTADVLDLIAWGPKAEADRATRRVRAVHRRVRGELTEPAGPFAAGTPYAADDPELLLWILATLVDSNVLVFEKYVRRLSPAELEALWSDYRVVGRLFGIGERHLPPDWPAFRRYMGDMLGSGALAVTGEARDLAIDIVMHPPVPRYARPLVELVNQVTIGLLPAGLRREYGFGWDPLRGLMLAGGAEYARRVLVPLAPRRVRYVAHAQRRAA